MTFTTKVEIPQAVFQIQPCEQVLLVGSCFADEIGCQFKENGFRVTANPYGTMYNPVSILHTLQRWLPQQTEATLPRIVFLTLGTNHVYRLKETGEIVDNCEKRPASLFQEEELTVSECVAYLQESTDLLRKFCPSIQIVLTVSPIRYRKYGYHGSQLSKATLLLAANQVMKNSLTCQTSYFPAYEIMMDELRDYRFYAPDMLHPSEQAVCYLWERLSEWCFSPECRQCIEEWIPIWKQLHHRPFHPDSEEHHRQMAQAQLRARLFTEKYPDFNIYPHE